MPDNDTKHEKTAAPVGRDPKEVAHDLSERALALRSEWNTNADHPKAKDAIAFASLLEEAAEALSKKK